MKLNYDVFVSLSLLAHKGPYCSLLAGYTMSQTWTVVAVYMEGDVLLQDLYLYVQWL
jgi:hypothetical protein